MARNNFNSPTTPYVPQSRPGSYAGWYDADVFSVINLKETDSLAYNRSPELEGIEHITSPVVMSSRERVRSIRIKKRTTVQAEGVARPRDRSTSSNATQESAIASSEALGTSDQMAGQLTGRQKERLTILMPENYTAPVQLRKEEPGSTVRQRPSPHTALSDVQSTPQSSDRAKSRKSNRLTRLIVEKIILKVDESPVSSNPGTLEEGKQVPKARSFKLKPVQIALETFFLLLPMLGALYMLASCCLPNVWWRERLSIVRISMAAGNKGEESSALLLGLWGWCVTRGEAVKCSEPKLLYAMDDFFAATGHDGLNPGTFVPATMGAFVTLLPSAGLACIGSCFVLWHIYQRCVKNDRRQSASKWQQLVILLALLSTGAFWAVTEVFHSQLSDRLAPSMVFENGQVGITPQTGSPLITFLSSTSSIPLLALSSLILLAIALLASVLPVLLAWIRSQYYYHGQNLAVANASVDTVTTKASVKPRGEEKKETPDDKQTTEDKAKKHLTSIGKRMTKIFSSGDSESQSKDGPKGADLENAWEELKDNPKRTESSSEVESEAKRKTLLKRLTMKT